MESRWHNRLGVDSAIPAMAGLLAPVAFTVTPISALLIQSFDSYLQQPFLIFMPTPHQILFAFVICALGT